MALLISAVISLFSLTLASKSDLKLFPTRLFSCCFCETFWIAPKGPPFICFDILKHNGCQKIPKGPPFYIFRHCDTVQKSHFFGQFFSVLKGSPPSIFFIFCNQLEFHKAQRVPPFTFFDTVTLFISFFPYFATSWSFAKPKESPLLQF